MALAAAAASVAASNDYFFDPFSAAAQAAAVSQSSLPTPGKSISQISHVEILAFS